MMATTITPPVAERATRAILNTWNRLSKAKTEEQCDAILCGVQVNYQLPNSETLLYWTCGYRRATNVMLINSLIRAGADPNIPTRQHYMPLHLAARENDCRAIAALLAAGASIEGMPPYTSPLHIACLNRHVEAVTALLDAGASMTSYSGRGLTAFMSVALTSEYDDEYGDDAEDRRAELCDLLLARGGNVNDTNSEGLPLLHMAAEEGDLRLVMWLLDHGAYPRSRDANGLTALDRLGLIEEPGVEDDVPHGPRAEIIRVLRRANVQI